MDKQCCHDIVVSLPQQARLATVEIKEAQVGFEPRPNGLQIYNTTTAPNQAPAETCNS